MTVLEFYQNAGATFLANVLSFVAIYGIWRATNAEKRLGIPNGGSVLPIWLLGAMALGPLLLAWSAATLD